jgi:uncharacterized protein YndB with AHSA1/START domain
MAKGAALSADDHFVITRVFDAPRDLVWRAWTEPDRIVAWFGPRGAPRARVLRHELRVGGMLLTARDNPDGTLLCDRFVYREISPVSRLVWVHGFGDPQGGLARHPTIADWPLELMTTVTFVELGDRTEVTMDWLPLAASAAERTAFDKGRPQSHAGWSGSFDVLADLLRKR